MQKSEMITFIITYIYIYIILYYILVIDHILVYHSISARILFSTSAWPNPAFQGQLRWKRHTSDQNRDHETSCVTNTKIQIQIYISCDKFRCWKLHPSSSSPKKFLPRQNLLVAVPFSGWPAVGAGQLRSEQPWGPGIARVWGKITTIRFFWLKHEPSWTIQT